MTSHDDAPKLYYHPAVGIGKASYESTPTPIAQSPCPIEALAVVDADHFGLRHGGDRHRFNVTGPPRAALETTRVQVKEHAMRVTWRDPIGWREDFCVDSSVRCADTVTGYRTRRRLY